MKPLQYLLLLTAFFYFGSDVAHAQSKKEPVAQEKEHYRKSLGLDSVKAGKVQQLQENYKKELNALMADSLIGTADRATRIRQLMEKKNDGLKKLLNPAQQRKIIPPSEHISSRTNK